MGKRGINMNNAIQNIISLIRANPEFAKVAITFDAFIGIVFGLLAYVGMNATNVEVTNIVVLALAAAFALAAIAISGYTVLYTTGYSFDDDGD